MGDRLGTPRALGIPPGWGLERWAGSSTSVKKRKIPKSPQLASERGKRVSDNVAERSKTEIKKKYELLTFFLLLIAFLHSTVLLCFYNMRKCSIANIMCCKSVT